MATDRYQRSAALYAEAKAYLAGGVSSTFRLGGTPAPLTFQRGHGARLIDVDENEYVDYALGMGPAILGHAPEAVTRAVAETLSQGQLYAGQHPAEYALARKFCELAPCAERVRFGSSGSEAVQAALRLARAYTGRSKIVRFEGHYHGWLDNIAAGPALDNDAHPIPISAGQPASALSELYLLPWNDLNVFRRFVSAHADEIAGVIMEPILCNTGVIVPRPGYLEGVRELCQRFNLVLIFDEVITGFRVGLAGAQGLLGVTPDLAVFAKALGAGYPISAVAGRAEIMETANVLHGGSYNANVVSSVAALTTLEVLSANDGAAYQAMTQMGEQLIAGIRDIAQRTGARLKVQGVGTVFNTAFTDQAEIVDWRAYQGCDAAALAKFVRTLQDHGVYVTRRGTWFLSTAHTAADVTLTLRAIENALQREGVMAIAV
ncbi:MAG: aspartate aminotransferase family protein [Anaerolineales bacterium]